MADDLTHPTAPAPWATCGRLACHARKACAVPDDCTTGSQPTAPARGEDEEMTVAIDWQHVASQMREALDQPDGMVTIHRGALSLALLLVEQLPAQPAEDVERCEGCGQPAECLQRTGDDVALCHECYDVAPLIPCPRDAREDELAELLSDLARAAEDEAASYERGDAHGMSEAERRKDEARKAILALFHSAREEAGRLRDHFGSVAYEMGVIERADDAVSSDEVIAAAKYLRRDAAEPEQEREDAAAEIKRLRGMLSHKYIADLEQRLAARDAELAGVREALKLTPDADVGEAVRVLRDSYVRVTERLQDACQRHGLGLGGEQVDALVVEALDVWRAIGGPTRARTVAANALNQLAARSGAAKEGHRAE